MRRARALLRVVASSFAVTMLAHCSSTATTSQSLSSGASVIKIGIDLPVSGADASTGIPTRDGAVLAIEEADAKPPAGYTFAADDLDDAVEGTHDPAQGAQNVRAFIADPAVLAMIGPFNSNVARAEIPLTNDAGLAQISPATTSDGLTEGPDAAALRTSHPDRIAFFRVCTTNARQGEANARIARKLGLRKAFVVDDDETYGKGLADIFSARFAAEGGTVVGREHLTKGQTDFKALLTKAHALDPDLLFYGGTTSTGGGLLRKQMSDAGMGSLPLFGGDGIADAEFVTVAGNSADGTYYTVAAPEIARLPSARTFVAAYEKRFGANVGPYSANAYAAATIEIAAIEGALAAGSGRAPTRAAVLGRVARTKDFPTPIGPVGFAPNGDTTDPILSVYRIEDRKPVFVDEIKLKT